MFITGVAQMTKGEDRGIHDPQATNPGYRRLGIHTGDGIIPFTQK